MTASMAASSALASSPWAAIDDRVGRPPAPPAPRRSPVARHPTRVAACLASRPSADARHRSASRSAACIAVASPVRKLLEAPLVPRGALLKDARDVGNLNQIAAFRIEEGTGLRALEQRRSLAVGHHDRRHAGALGSQFLQVRAPRVELIDERLQGRRLVPLRAETLNLRGRRLDLYWSHLRGPRQAPGERPRHPLQHGRRVRQTP